MAKFPKKLTIGPSDYQTTYELVPEQILIKVRKNANEKRLESFLSKGSFETKAIPEYVQRARSTLEPAGLRWITILPDDDGAFESAQSTLEKYRAIEEIRPVYFEAGGGPETAATPMFETVMILIEDDQFDTALKSLAKLGLKYNKAFSSALAPVSVFTFSNDADLNIENALAISTKAMKVKGVQSVEFDWLKLETYLLTPNDPLFGNQWNMQTISAEGAWDIETGDQNIWIAIIDSGFDLNHPDLNFTPNTAGNPTHCNADDFISGNPTPYNAGSSGVFHGTACAGISAANINSNIGVAGLAGACQIMPVRLGTVPTSARVAAGINWARLNGASVGSLSLGTSNTTAAINAVVNAWNGGMILCAATGNSAGNTSSPSINFPANHPNTIAVGASDQNDQRKRPASVDGENWGSQYGTEIDVIAPGVRIWTTDEQGTSGYNPSSSASGGDYFNSFNGTSSATPLVAGLAALIMSANSSLSNQEVRDLIESTCDKVSPGLYTYANTPGRTNGTWHQEVGYGRINAFQALLRATASSSSAHSSDIALVRQTPGWATIPVAFSNSDGTWTITNSAAPNFIPSWANQPGVRIVTGDFNGNGRTDIALVRQTPGWATIPIAFSNSDGTWTITNGAAPNFIPSWANQPGVRIVTGDFNGNDRTDIALIRQTPGWATIPVAFSNSDGTWTITNGAAPNFIPSWANQPGVKIVTGDFNGNGRTDIALIRQTPGWATIPVAFSNSDGTWTITNGAAPNFIPSWANQPGVRIVTGDFNGNGRTDIALVRQTPGWATIPIAFSNSDGTWTITNGAAPNFIPSWANQPGVRIVTGDFNGNGRTDIALVRQTPGWATIPIAFSNSDGTWTITNGAAPNFIPSWANQPGVRIVTGDFNDNGRTDIALVRQTPGWATIPIAFSNSDGTWTITNGAAPNFIPSWANQPGVRIVTGDYR